MAFAHTVVIGTSTYFRPPPLLTHARPHEGVPRTPHVSQGAHAARELQFLLVATRSASITQPT